MITMMRMASCQGLAGKRAGYGIRMGCLSSSSTCQKQGCHAQNKACLQNLVLRNKPLLIRYKFLDIPLDFRQLLSYLLPHGPIP